MREVEGAQKSGVPLTLTRIGIDYEQCARYLLFTIIACQIIFDYLVRIQEPI